jgi:hypothetical protein
MPMIRATMVEQQREGRQRGEAPEIAVLSDCRTQFEHEGLQRLVMDLAIACAAATQMFSALSPLTPVELLKQFAAGTAVDEALGQLKDGDVVWGYVPAMTRPLLEPGTKPGMDEVLFEIDHRYGFSASMDFIVALAYYAAAVARRLAEVIGGPVEQALVRLERGTEPQWEALDRYDTRSYARR